MIASTTNVVKVSPQLQQQLQQKKLQLIITATVAATITTAVRPTVITYVQNGVDMFRKQTGVNVDPSGIGWV